MNKPRSSPALNAHPLELPALYLTHLPTNFNTLLPIIPITVGERSPAGRNITNSFSAGVLPHFPTHWSALYFIYLEKGCLIPDLLAKGILFTDETGRLPAKYTGEKDASPQIVRAIPSGDQTESFIRFRVNNIDLSCTPELWDSFLHFYESQLTDQDYCTVLGEKTAISMLSPQKIRNAGDGAKLISSNDETNFTFRGRFFNPRQALSIGYRTTQEAHSALRWLISRQGTNLGDESILVWGTQDEPVPSLCDDTYDLAQNAPADDLDDMEIPEFALMPSQEASTAEAIARQFNRAIHGYRLKLTDTSQLSVLILDSPSVPKAAFRSGIIRNSAAPGCWKIS